MRAAAGTPMWHSPTKSRGIPARVVRSLGDCGPKRKANDELAAGIEPVQVYGSEDLPKPNKLELPLGDLASGEECVLLVELPFSLTFDDIERADKSSSSAAKHRSIGATDSLSD